MSNKRILIAALPMFIVIVGLLVALALVPKNSETRGKAAEPTPIVTKVVLPATSPNAGFPPNTVCAELYQPVCGTDNHTYTSVCEANLHNIGVKYAGACR